MVDPFTGAIAMIAGAAVSANSARKEAKKQERAAAEANARMAAAADVATATSSNENAASQTNTKQAAQNAIDASATRRSSMNKTVNRYRYTGLREKLG